MKYGVMLRGENLEILVDGEVQNWGFITTRFVKASTLEQAELAAVELVRNDRSLHNMLVSSSTLTPKIYRAEIFQVKWWKRLGGKGYTFFDMSSEETGV